MPIKKKKVKKEKKKIKLPPPFPLPKRKILPEGEEYIPKVFTYISVT